MLWLAAPTHNFKRVKITHICLIGAHIYVILDV